MFGTNRIARAVYASLTEEERQLEKLALPFRVLKPGANGEGTPVPHKSNTKGCAAEQE